MIKKISAMLDAVADSLEKKGLIKEAYEIDKIADYIEVSTLEGLIKNPDGTYSSDGNVNANAFIGQDGKLKIRFKEVKGNFSGWDGRFTSLEGSPRIVGGNFHFHNCKRLTSLQGAPETVMGDFDCSRCGISSLEGSPKIVNGAYSCSENRLTNLNGAPKTVGYSFDCNNCGLTSLEGAPETVGDSFSCKNNRLTSLQGAPKNVGGDFYCDRNSTQFTPQHVKAVSNVKGHIYYTDLKLQMFREEWARSQRGGW